MLALSALFSIACGSAETNVEQQANSCETSAEELISRSPVCDDASFNSLKKEAINWKKSCEDSVRPLTKDRLAQAVGDSQKCVDDTHAALAKRDECDAKIGVLYTKKNCDEEIKCIALIEEVAKVTALCEPSVKHGFDKQRAVSLDASLKSRIGHLKRQDMLQQTIEMCKKATAMTDKKDVDGALNGLVPILANILSEPSPEPPTADSIYYEAKTICKNALESTMDLYLSEMSQNLTNKKATKDPITWMSNYRHIVGMRSRLTEVQANQLVPNIMAGVEKLMADVDKKKNEIESAAVAKEEALVKETLIGGAEKCAFLTKEIERIELKVEEHTKKKNEKKVRAYTRQLERVNQKRNTFLASVKEAKKKTPFDAAKTEKLLKKISKAGCSAETPAE
jgi:hypothetical protein